MGRIDEALSKTKGKRMAKNSRAQRTKEPVSIADTMDGATTHIDFSKLPIMSPDPACLVENRIVAAQPDAPARSAYKVLRTRVLQRLRSSRWNVIGVTGTGPGEGKTLTAINLAYSLAQDVNHRVVLVDLDLRRPAIHRSLGLEPRYDLLNFLDGNTKLEDILIRPDEKRLAIMTNQSKYRDSSELLSSPQLGALIHQLKNLGPNTITVVDLPPVLAGDDVLAFAPLVDAFLLVVSQGKCRREHLAEAQELLKEANFLGAVLNNSREKSASSGYYDYY